MSVGSKSSLLGMVCGYPSGLGAVFKRCERRWMASHWVCGSWLFKAVNKECAGSVVVSIRLDRVGLFVVVVVVEEELDEEEEDGVGTKFCTCLLGRFVFVKQSCFKVVDRVGLVIENNEPVIFEGLVVGMDEVLVVGDGLRVGGTGVGLSVVGDVVRVDETDGLHTSC